MALERKDSVRDTTATTGTGTVSLADASISGFRSFLDSGLSSGAKVRYRIYNSLQTEWEVGEGIFTAAGNTLSRAAVFASSNANALVNFSAGTKIVDLTMTSMDSQIGGYELTAIPDGFALGSTGVQANPVNGGFALPIVLRAPMYVDSLQFNVTTSGSGTVQWGLFDVTTPTAGEMVASGSGALSSVGIRSISASGAPVLVPAGVYMLVIAFPSSNCPSVRRSETNGGVSAYPCQKYFNTSYTWTTTPNMTLSNWVIDSAVLWVVLKGRLSPSAAW